MITPAFSLTATERVLPRLALDFTTASLDARVTISRALNTAARFNSSGLIETVNADLPRFDFNETGTGVCKGLLIEEARTNFCRYSSQFERGEWQNASPNYPTVNADTLDTLSPDGTNNADKVTAATGGTGSHLRQSISGTFSGAYTYSIFVKAGNSVQSRIRLFDNGFATVGNALINWSGTTISSLSSVTGTASFTALKDGWYRVVVTTASLGSNASLLPSFYPDSSAGTGYVYLYGADLEAGAFATSYIPTTTTSLTRNADVVTMTGTNFSSWFNPTEGTLSFEGSVFVDQGSTTVDFIQISNNVSNSISIDIAMFTATGPCFQVINGTAQANIDTGSISLNTVFKIAGAYKENSFVGALNGQNPITDNTGTIPSGLIKMGIGTRLSGPYMNGHARKFSYWPQRLTNAEVQAFAK